jgi:hypothetical protein
MHTLRRDRVLLWLGCSGNLPGGPEPPRTGPSAPRSSPPTAYRPRPDSCHSAGHPRPYELEAAVAEIRVRNPAQSEFSFTNVEEFATLVQTGGITADWEIYHQAAGRWIPVTRYPKFRAWVGEEA